MHIEVTLLSPCDTLRQRFLCGCSEMINWCSVPERDGMDGSWELLHKSLLLVWAWDCCVCLDVDFLCTRILRGARALRPDGYRLFNRRNKRNRDGSRSADHRIVHECLSCVPTVLVKFVVRKV